VEFKVGNIDLLKKAIKKEGYVIVSEKKNGIEIMNSQLNKMTINFADSKITSENLTQSKLVDTSNALKRAYSLQVIEEISKRNKWIKKDMGQNRYQLQRF
jgi:hypothetical protein